MIKRILIAIPLTILYVVAFIPAMIFIKLFDIAEDIRHREHKIFYDNIYKGKWKYEDGGFKDQ